MVANTLRLKQSLCGLGMPRFQAKWDSAIQLCREVAVRRPLSLLKPLDTCAHLLETVMLESKRFQLRPHCTPWWDNECVRLHGLLYLPPSSNVLSLTSRPLLLLFQEVLTRFWPYGSGRYSSDPHHRRCGEKRDTPNTSSMIVKE
eukprot:3389153-Amphidinium_carterae.1